MKVGLPREDSLSFVGEAMLEGSYWLMGELLFLRLKTGIEGHVMGGV